MSNFAAGNRLVENGPLISNTEDLQPQNNITDAQGYKFFFNILKLFFS